MPAVRQKSALFAKYGAKLDQGVQKHAADPTDYGPVNLPPGIKNGIARLVECGFFQYKPDSNMKTAAGKSAVGEYYFRAAGVVVEPTAVHLADGSEFPVAGLQTSIMEPVCDTKTTAGKITTQEEHVENILNEMRKLGGDDFTHGATAADLEQLAADLKERAPHFRFSTSAGQATPAYPNPRTWENWNGAKGLENYAPADDGGAVQDDSGPANDVPAGEAPAGDETAAPDLDALLAQAQDDTDVGAMEDAQKELCALALAAGATQEQFDAADWDGVRAMIEGGGEAPAEEPKANPAKGDPCKYGILDPKTKKTKMVDCEITSVSTPKRTLTLKNLTTGKPVVGKDGKPLAVAWDAVELA